jgi:transketolase
VQIINMIGRAGEGYLLQGLGAADLFAALFFAELHYDPRNPRWPDRDRLLLSTAHNSAVLYASLAESGFIGGDALLSYGVDGSDLEIIASEHVPGVEGTFGSLGQGLSVAVGMALYAKRTERTHRVYVVLGDGELQEGQVWEAAMAAASFKLDNLCVILDYNKMQVEGHIDTVIHMGDIAAKWRAFGWHVQEIDGHEMSGIMDSFEAARARKGQPSIIIARTLTGKGVPFLEGAMSHYEKLPPEKVTAALAALKTP